VKNNLASMVELFAQRAIKVAFIVTGVV